MSPKNTSYWIDFFLASNLPQSISTKYAMIFTDHRIQENMLEDLTKDMLYDMGIKTIGDIIAILKRAREVTDERIQRELMSKHSSESRKVKLQPSEVNKVSTTHQPISGPSVSSTTLRVLKRKSTGDSTDMTKEEPKVKRILNNSSERVNMMSGINIQRTVTFPDKKTAANAHQDSASVSVFRRLGEASGKGNNDNQIAKFRPNITQNPSIIRTIKGNSTVTVETQRTLGVKERLGSRGSLPNKPTKGLATGFKGREVTSSTIRPKQVKKGTTLSLKKSIFDRLGPKNF